MTRACTTRNRDREPSRVGGRWRGQRALGACVLASALLAVAAVRAQEGQPPDALASAPPPDVLASAQPPELAGALAQDRIAAARTRAARRVLSRGPHEVRAGERLALELQVAHGLTPPPGIQNERALRGFAARLCAADARCVHLPTLNVRPRDGWSLVYRAEFAVPPELAAGRYDLDVRFPGGSDSLPAGVSIAATSTASVPRAFAKSSLEPAGGCALAAIPSIPSIGGSSPGHALGLLLVVLSRKLAAGRRPRAMARE